MLRITSNSTVYSGVYIKKDWAVKWNDTNLSKETWEILRTFYFTDALSTSTLRGLDYNWIAYSLCTLQRTST